MTAAMFDLYLHKDIIDKNILCERYIDGDIFADYTLTGHRFSTEKSCRYFGFQERQGLTSDSLKRLSEVC